MINRAALSRNLRALHRKTSLTLFLWLFFVALTGLALNHSKDFSLDALPMPAVIRDNIYGVAPPVITSFHIEGIWVSQAAGNQIYWGKEALGFCGKLVGVSSLAGEIYIACEDSLYLVNLLGQIIEQLGPSHGLPVPIEAFGRCGENPCLLSRDQNYTLNPQFFTWNTTDSQLTAVSASAPPDGLKKELERLNSPAEFNLERLVRDFHSGAFFGLGPWLMDIFAIALMTLALSGLTLWWLGRKPR